MRDSPAKPTSAAAGRCRGSQPPGVRRPREGAAAWRNTPSSSRPSVGGAAAVVRGGSGAGVSVTTWTRSQPSPSSSPTTVRIRRSCGGEHRGRDRPVALGVAGAAYRRGGVQHHGDRREPGGPGHREVCRSSRRVEAQGVDDDGQPAAGPRGDDPVQQVERVHRRVEVRRAAADHLAQRVGGHDLRGAVARRAQWDLPDPDAPTRTTRAGSGSSGIRAGQPLSQLLDVELTLGVPAAQHLLVELADARLRHLVDERPPLGQLPVRELVLEELAQRLRGGGGSLPERRRWPGGARPTARPALRRRRPRVRPGAP